MSSRNVSGNAPCTASLEPVRSASSALSEAKASAATTASASIAATPAGPDATDTPNASPIPRYRIPASSASATAPASWPSSSAQRRSGVSAQAVEHAALDVDGEVGAAVDATHHRRLHERAGQRELQVGVGGEARDVRSLHPCRAVTTASRISGNTSAGKAAAGWRSVRATERRVSQPNCVRAITPRPPRAAGPRSPAPGRSWPGRRRPATARAAGSCAIASPSASSARTTSASAASPPRRRTATPPLRAATGSPNGVSASAIAAASSACAGAISTLGQPMPAFSAAGVPSATIRPRSMIPTRSASTSASSRYWVVRKTVTPSSCASARTSSHSAVRLRMSRPVVGSSRKSTDGRCTSASARSRRRFMPPDSLAILRVATSASPTRSSSSSPRRARSRRPSPCSAPCSCRCSRAREHRVERDLLQRGADHAPHGVRLGRHVEAADRGPAAGGRQQRREHQDGRRLAGAVGPEKAVDLARPDVQVDAVDGVRSVRVAPREPLGAYVDALGGPHRVIPSLQILA